MQRSNCSSFLVLLLTVGGVHFALAELSRVDPDYSMLTRAEGEVPILLSAPHGGWQQPDDVDSLNTGVHESDWNTYDLGLAVRDKLIQELGQEPYYVFTQIARRWVDVNRDPGTSEAWVDSDAKKYYEGYHQLLRDYVESILETWGKGLLIDIHGQSAYSAQILRGTQNGLTVEVLLASHGIDGLTGPSSVFGQIAQAGYSVYPENEDELWNPPEMSGYSGGFIVGKYGSHNATGVDAIQVEIGRDFRDSSGSNEYTIFGNALGEAIASCYDAFYATSVQMTTWSELKLLY
jgi:N-formylglutamate amidohydrolase